VNGRRLKPAVDAGSSGSIEQTESLTLTHDQDNISFEYTAIHFSRPQEITFEYRLDGFDSEWQSAGRRRIANYTNLDPGDYTFRVRAFNSRVQSERNARINLAILEPWWTSWWAYGLWLLSFVGVLYGAYSYRVRRLKARSEMLEDLVSERMHDLEEEKRRTEEQAKRLVELDEAKNRFFANISHEFRTPMMLILGPLQDLLDGVHGRFSRGARKQLGTMHRNADRMLGLITQLLDLTRMDSGQLEVRRIEVHLIDHLQALVQSFVPMAERGGVTLEFVTDENELNFYSDPDMLDKVVGNLLSNAIKFTPEGGNIWVTSRLRSDESVPTLEILVKDTGPGIPKHELAHIFDRFASFDPSSSKATSWARSHEGIGIGLALAKELAELHNGAILVESVPGFGSTFTVRLPYEPVVARLHETDEGTEEAHANTTGQGDGLGRVETEMASILVVDDNADVRAYVRTHFCDQYRVIEAANGEDGLEAVRAEEPDLVLTDVMMPVMDGYALCRELKSDEKLRDIPVIMLTAKAGEENTLEGLESGADEYIPKPFSMPEMKARVANLIEARRHMRSRFSREVVVQPAGITIESEDELFLNRVLEAIDAHLGDSNFSVDWLADEVGMSNRHLRRRVEAVTGEPPAELIRRMRLKRASQLLEGHAGTVAEVAYRVGFKSVSHFSRRFNERYGVRPSEWDGNKE
jgi:signal transduction histidine kinase/DNA-binding response OmpR family regulator